MLDRIVSMLTKLGQRGYSVSPIISRDNRVVLRGDNILAVARKCADKVVIPERVDCCGFAGDRGFSFPELNAAARADLKPAVEGITRGALKRCVMPRCGLKESAMDLLIIWFGPTIALWVIAIYLAAKTWYHQKLGRINDKHLESNALNRVPVMMALVCYVGISLMGPAFGPVSMLVISLTILMCILCHSRCLAIIGSFPGLTTSMGKLFMLVLLPIYLFAALITPITIGMQASAGSSLHIDQSNIFFGILVMISTLVFFELYVAVDRMD